MPVVARDLNRDAPLAGRRALVTGAGGRLGGVVARELARAGAEVFLHTRRRRKIVAEIARGIRRNNGAATTLHADLGVRGAGEDLFQRALRRAGRPPRLDLLVIAADDHVEGNLLDADSRTIADTLSLAVEAPLELTRAFARHRRTLPPSPAAAATDAAGAVVYLLDARLADCPPGRELYILGKRAQAALMELSARAFAPTLRINAVAPGAVDFAGDEGFDSAAARAAAPLGRLPAPDEVAAAVLWLATAPSVAGQTLYIDGGRHFRRR